MYKGCVSQAEIAGSNKFVCEACKQLLIYRPSLSSIQKPSLHQGKYHKGACVSEAKTPIDIAVWIMEK